MKILGIDYGRRKMGFSIADGPMSEPLEVIRYLDSGILVEKIKKIIAENSIEKIVIGISEGQMGQESKHFGKSLGKIVKIPVETFDETLSTQDARRMSREAGIGPKKRHQMEDAYAAAIMLQNYLDMS